LQAWTKIVVVGGNFNPWQSTMMLAGGDATFKSDLQSLFLSIHRLTHYAVSGTSPLLQETFIIHLFYHTCFLHSADSVFILVVLGF